MDPQNHQLNSALQELCCSSLAFVGTFTTITSSPTCELKVKRGTNYLRVDCFIWFFVHTTFLRSLISSGWLSFPKHCTRFLWLLGHCYIWRGGALQPWSGTSPNSTTSPGISRLSFHICFDQKWHFFLEVDTIQLHHWDIMEEQFMAEERTSSRSTVITYVDTQCRWERTRMMYETPGVGSVLSFRSSLFSPFLKFSDPELNFSPYLMLYQYVSDAVRQLSQLNCVR